MNICPHCGADPCLPFFRKLALEPSVGLSCQTCGLRVCAEYKHFEWVLLPPALVMLAVVTGMLSDPVPMVTLFILSLFVACGLYAVLVGLRRDEFSSPDIVAAGKAHVAAQKQEGRIERPSA